MEYFRTENGQIQADMASRLGTILWQYHTQIIAIEKYEVTLTISVLQSLLTNCIELLKSLSKDSRKNDPLSKSIEVEDPWNLKVSIKKNTHHEPNLSTLSVLRHIRNALSHPTIIDINAEYMSTGYTTKNHAAAIESVIFSNSPDVFSGEFFPRTFKSFEKANEYLKRNRESMPSETSIVKNSDDNYYFQLGGQPFYRHFLIELSKKQMLNLAYGLCQYLSQPLKKEWNGTDFEISLLEK